MRIENCRRIFQKTVQNQTIFPKNDTNIQKMYQNYTMFQNNAQLPQSQIYECNHTCENRCAMSIFYQGHRQNKESPYFAHAP